MDRRILESQDKKQSYTDKISLESRVLFSLLKYSTEAFDCKDFINKLVEYINKYNRIQYSFLSELIYRSDEDERLTIYTNLDSLINFSSESEFDLLFKDQDDSKKSQIKKTLLKIWDHSNLASAQYTELTRDDFYEKFYAEKQEIEREYQDLINSEGKKINRELIAMVAIFTAMSFLVFGGLNSLSAILSQTLNEIPVLTICVECFIWGLCIYNMIYLFMYLIGKLIKEEIASRVSTKFYKRHLVFLFGNGIIIVALIITGWLYFIQTDLNGWYSVLHAHFGALTKILPVFLLPIILVMVLLYHVAKRIKKAAVKCHYIRKYDQPVIIQGDIIYDKEWNVLEVRDRD